MQHLSRNINTAAIKDPLNFEALYMMAPTKDGRLISFPFRRPPRAT
jgi:hypothetical protein